MRGAKKKPRDSRQTMEKMLERVFVVLMCLARCEITASVATGSRKMGKMSTNSWFWGVLVRYGGGEGDVQVRGG